MTSDRISGKDMGGFAFGAPERSGGERSPEISQIPEQEGRSGC